MNEETYKGNEILNPEEKNIIKNKLYIVDVKPHYSYSIYLEEKDYSNFEYDDEVKEKILALVKQKKLETFDETQDCIITLARR